MPYSSLTGSVSVSVDLSGDKDVGSGAGVSADQPRDTENSQSFSTEASYTSAGAGVNQADEAWFDVRELAASGSETLDLAGSLTNAFGDTVTFARIKALVIERVANDNGSTQATSFTVGGAGSNTWVGPFGAATDTITVRSGWFGIGTDDATGYAVTAGTGDQLLITNDDGTNKLTYRITLIGATS